MTIDFAAAVAAETAAGGVTGASFAYWDGATLHTAVGGKRNSVTGDPVTLDTLMHIGSITKLLNAVLFLQLVDDGLVDLDDLVARHLPELRLGDPRALETLTCRMLLNHTSGIDFDAPDYARFEEQRIDVAIRDCATKSQLHAPGEATSYSNIGTVIAGHIAETVRGEGWYELIKARIFAPLGLDHALVDITEVPRFRVGIGDQIDAAGKAVQSARPFLPLGFAPAGATAMMTAADLVRFAQALVNGGIGSNGVRIVSAESAALMMVETTRFASPPSWRVGLGWLLLPGGVLNHAGGGPGVNSMLYAHPASGRAFAILTNSARYDAFATSLVDPILESWGAKPPVPVALPGLGRGAAYEGVYENQLFRYEIGIDGDRLMSRFAFKMALYEAQAGAPAVALERIGEDLFQVAAGGAVDPFPLAFTSPDASGRMQRLATMGRILNRA